MRMVLDPLTDVSSGVCDRCGRTLFRYRGQGDIECGGCGAIYNCFGQRLRDDLYSRPNRSAIDDDCIDLDGDEESWLQAENRWDS